MLGRVKKLKQFLFPPRAVSSQVMFYSSSVVDELWVRTTALATRARGIDCCIVLGRGVLDADVHAAYAKAGIPVFTDAGRAFLLRCKIPVIVTASSGLPADWFAPTARWRIHMPHSIVSLHMIYSADCFDGYNMLFAVGPHHQAEFDALTAARKLPLRPVIAVGYGKLDVLQSALKPVTPGAVPHILLAPSWGAQNILNTIGGDLIDRLLGAGYRVTLRPHPLFFVENDPLLPAFEKRFSGNNDFEIESSLGFGRAMFDADLLITDYSGTAQEFSALRGQPVVFVDVPKKILNPDWQSLGIMPLELRSRGVLGPLVIPDCAAVTAAVAGVLDNRGAWQANAEKFTADYLYSRDCAATASAALQSLINNLMAKGIAA